MRTRILYLTYSGQSGVISFLTDAFSKKGIEVTVFQVAKNLSYRTGNLKLPSFKPHNLFNAALSVMRYKSEWKTYFLRTDYAFKFMTREAERCLEKNMGRFDVIMQSGVLFSASFKNTGAPYYLYLDHVYAISKKYQEIKGLPRPRCASKNWEILERGVYEKSDIIFTMSRFVKDSLIKDYGVSGEKIAVVGAGPNLPAIPAPSRESGTDGKTILFVGKEFRRKGGATLLEAFDLVRHELPDAKLVIVGSNEDIHGPGIQNMGEIDFAMMPAIYQSASLFVLPTLREPFGLAFLEAMAHRLACVGTDVEAVPEIIDDGKTGFIVPCLNPEKLAEKIALLLRDRELADRMGQEGYKKVRDYFNWDAVSSRIISRISGVSA
ncbi:MAG: glycosyltransferase family 4 protein [Candidatus Omnitrophica bacterium]|nr:glycosyltransferase family 4 protein [Candidatus Omnitrophota bacterium]